MVLQWQKVGGDVAANGIWVSGDKVTMLCDDTTICTTSQKASLGGPTDQWGDDDKEMSFVDNDITKKTTYSGSNKLHGIWGDGANNLWVVGDKGTVLHSNGGAWSPATTQFSSMNLNAVYGSKDSLWAVGDHGAILHYDGKTWSQIPSPHDHEY